MGYKVKRGSSATNHTIKEMLLGFFRRLLVVVIVSAVMVAIAYFLLHLAYVKFPVFATAADQVLKLIKDFYIEHGLWATIGVFIFICIAVWALGEELKRKERKKEAVR